MISLSAILAIALSTTAPNFFHKMEGHWSATGSRRQTFSGKETRIEMDTQTSVQNETLISQSTVKEVDVASGGVRIYGTAFWMRAHSPASEGLATDAVLVDLGSGDDPSLTVATSTGSFQNGTLVVIQHFAGDYLIRSETEFTADPSQTHYREATYHGETLLSETALEYRKID